MPNYRVERIETSGVTVPLVTVAGSALDCGRQYGSAVAAEVGQTIESYFRTFRDHHDLAERDVFELARRFEPVIEEYDATLLDEMHGVAEGAAEPYEAILAINARSELVHGLKARLDDGCTSFAVFGPATQDARVIIGQNWDWSAGVRKVTVLMDVRRDDEPRALFMTEAGLLGKFGLNESGVGFVGNFLLSDTRRFGTPVHMIRRKVLSARSLGDAVGAVVRTQRALAANYLVAHADGDALSLEAWPNDVGICYPDAGILTHANHFSTPSQDRRDVGREIFPDSLLRDRRMKNLFEEARGEIDVQVCMRVLSDHFNAPDSICRHENERRPATEQIETLGSIICDLTDRILYFCSGNPCKGTFSALSLRS